MLIKYSVTEFGFDTRDLIRTFAPQRGKSKLLRWGPTLDSEDGSGIRVAHFDSRISWRHPALQGAQIKACDFTKSGGVFDPTGHGTKSVRLLVAQGRGLLRGIAPACTLLVGKVIGTGNPDSSIEAVVRSIRWAMHENAHIAILPFGWARGSPLVAREVCRAVAAGCVFFAAAGNRGPDTFLFPARLRGVSAVSAADPDGKPLEWCCQNLRVDCYAPGQAWSPRLKSIDTTNGSSLATVLAAGVTTLRLAREQRLQYESKAAETK